jgi:hypothetical protein
LHNSGALARIVHGEDVGTLVSNDSRALAG